MNVKQVWGKVLTRLREVNESALFVSCGEITNTKIENAVLIIQTDKPYLSELISSETNILALKRVLRFLGYNLSVEIELLGSKNEKTDKDIEFLKENFGNILKLN